MKDHSVEDMFASLNAILSTLHDESTLSGLRTDTYTTQLEHLRTVLDAAAIVPRIHHSSLPRAATASIESLANEVARLDSRRRFVLAVSWLASTTSSVEGYRQDLQERIMEVRF
jgi:hypothetical protein